MKTFKYYALVVFLSILPFIFIFSTPNLLHTSDGGVHIPRMGAYYKALGDLQVPVRWAGDLNYGYGLPLFNFMYHTPYLISSVLIFLKIDLVTTFKLVLLISYLLSGVFMFFFAKELFSDDIKALFVTVFYQYAPFRLVEMFVRGSVGEIYAYSFFPLVLYGITKINKKPTYGHFLLTSSAVFFLIISHNALSLVFFGVCIIWVLFFTKSIKSRIVSWVSLGVGLLLSSFYWVPALLEHKYTYGDLFMKDLYKQHFPPIQNFFIPNFTDVARLRTAEISVQFGLFHVIAIVLSLYLLFSKQKISSFIRALLIFAITITLGSLFIMEPISKPLWQHIPLLRQFQFPWRFLALTSFSTSFLSLSFLFIPALKKPWLLVGILFLTVITTGYYWYPPEGFDKVKDADFWNYPLNTTYFGETDLIWSEGPAKGFPPNRIQVIEGTAIISGLIKKTQIHTFSVSAQTDAKLVDNTQYFPGWRVYVDNQKTPVEFQDQNWRGLITFHISKGLHSVKVVFEESPIRYVSDIISILTAIILGIGVCIVKLRRSYETA